MLHKPDREPIYGVRGNMPFFKEWLELFPQKERTYEKTFVFSHVLLFYFVMSLLSIINDDLLRCCNAFSYHVLSHL